MRILILSTAILLAQFSFSFAQDPKEDASQLLQSGPMLGYSEMKEVMLWVQTVESATVQFRYWDKEVEQVIYETALYETKREEGFTAHLIANQVQPGKTYAYELRINDEPIKLDYPLEFQTIPNWAYREEPPKFKVAVGSCTYINEEPADRKGKPYGGEYEIFNSIYKKQPDLMLWLGDNTYYRPMDWNTYTGMIHRNTHTRSLPELQPLLASTHHYATWDDHDYGPNDHNRSFIHKQKSIDVFKMFWGNPVYGFMDEECAVTSFDWGDVQFYMLDDRWFRSANNLNIEDRPYFGKKQIDWLIESLKASRANFKIIATGGQVVNPAKRYENYANYEAERAYLLKRLEEENIWGVFFLSGDRHHSELTVMPRTNNYALCDLTVSPLTSGTHNPRDEGNIFQEEGSLISERNFAILEFSGTYKERIMDIYIYGVNGKKLWERQFKLQDVRPPRK